MLPNNIVIRSSETGKINETCLSIDNIIVTKGKIEVNCSDGTFFEIEDSSISPNKIVKQCKNSAVNLCMMVFQTFLNELEIDEATDITPKHRGKCLTVATDYMMEGAFEERTLFVFSRNAFDGFRTKETSDEI